MRKSNSILRMLKLNRRDLVNKYLKRTWIIFAVFIITLAVLSSVFRALTPFAKQYKPQVEKHLSMFLGHSVQIGKMETGWYWFEPVIKLEQVTVDGEQSKPLELKRLLVGINLLSSLWHWQIQPGVLYIDDVHLDLREEGGRWRIDGVTTAASVNELAPEVAEHFVTWLALHEKLILKRVSATLSFSDGHQMHLKDFDLKAINNNGLYLVEAKASVDKSTASLLADFYFDPRHLDHTKGQIYISLNQIKPEQLQAVLPEKHRYFDSGRGDVKLWLDIDEGHLFTAQSEVNFHNLALKFPGQSSHFFKRLSANLSWSRSVSGWQLTADQLNVTTKEQHWPENQLKLTYNQENHQYQWYVKHIILESLLTEVLDWYPPLFTLNKMQTHGKLHDSTFYIKDGQLEYFLSRFEKLGWQPGVRFPGMNNLAGVVHWQPDSGHLELDSNNVLLSAKELPAQTFSILNAGFDWKQLSHGLRLSIERLVLTQPDLTLSAHGVLDGLTTESLDHIHLVTDFSAKEVHRWLPFIPKNAFKPNLVKWLNTNIKRIDQVNGRLLVSGKMNDFPFDKSSAGEFKFNSHFSGVQLQFTPEWPLIREVDGYLRINNRALDIDLVHANINDIPVREINLKVDDVGYDKETLLVHARGQGPADKFLQFVMNSPLKKRLSLLDILTIQGLLQMDLRLQIPFYLGVGHTQARGQIALEDNTVKLQHSLGDLELNHLTGQLAFDEAGVTTSDLKAQAFGYPFHLSIHSVKQPQPYTLVDIQHQITMNDLRKQYDLPVFKLMHGQFQVTSTLKLTADPDDLDHLHIQSPLDGLVIDLPSPLGKTGESKKPLSMDIDFNPRKGLRFRMNYDKQLSSDFWFEVVKDSFKLYSGEVRLGSAKALRQSQPGVRLVGTVSDFDLELWQSTLAKLSAHTETVPIGAVLNYIDLHFKKAHLFNTRLDNLTLKASKTKTKPWAIAIDQEKIKGDLQYQPETNKLTGYLKRFIYRSVETKPQAKTLVNQLKPADIPNLNLRIDDFQYGDYNLGHITLASHSVDDRWVLDHGKLETPFYQLYLQGKWTHKANKNTTDLEARLLVSDLAKSLERFKISPVVEAHKGEITFEGGWPDSILNFSLSLLQGQMDIQFSNGRITHLSQETEEKLGLGKLLSILSLQTIPRRLKLDFSDLAQTGYSFDVFKGHFKLKNGKMLTSDSYIDGPVAYAGMKGALDLKKRLYDLDLKVSPHITASLPVVATIAGGPIAGIATWIASKIINKGMQNISAYTYKISGPWHQPVVQQLSITKRTAGS